ncbi:MAG: hypothetical protein GAK39_00842 [Variovorax sp.]|nr:MAG: hypothetical protein GAK39_00842 [Variovorax sp.]
MPNQKPEARHQQHQRGLHQPHQHRRQRLADHDLEWRHRRHQQLVEGALFALSRHRQRGQQQRLHHAEGGDHAGQQVPPRLEVGVEPGARLHGQRRRRQARAAAQLGVVALHHRAHVARGRARGVGVARIEDQLHRRALAGREPLLEVGAELHHQQRLLRVDDLADVGLRAQRGDAVEHTGAVEPRDQLGGRAAMALVEQRIGHVAQVVGGGVAEDQALHQRRHDQDHAARGVLEDREQFLAAEVGDAQQEVEHDAGPFSPGACA